MKREPPPTAYLGRIYTPLAAGGWSDYGDGALVVAPDGIIADIGDRAPTLARHPHCEVFDFQEKLILPGFVDCHQHLCHYDWIRLIPDLMEWLDQIYALEIRFQDESYAGRISRLFFADLARNGMTTCCVHGPYFPRATDIAFRAAESSGLRIMMGMNMGDDDLPEPLKRGADASLAESESLCSVWDGAADGRLSYCFTVRPAYCASAALLRGVAESARRNGARVQSHLGESVSGIRKILGRFPGRSSETDVYDSHGLLGPRTIMAHGVHLSDADYGLLARRGVAVAHCPRANLMAGGSQLDTRKADGAGVRMGLGTDLGAGKGLGLWRTMEDAMKVSPHLGIHDVWRLATCGGADALGVGASVGTLEPGHQADFLIADPRLRNARTPLQEIDIQDVLASLVFTGDDRCVEKVFVGGRAVSLSDS